MGLFVVVLLGCVMGTAIAEETVKNSISDGGIETARELIEQGEYRKILFLKPTSGRLKQLCFFIIGRACTPKYLSSLVFRGKVPVVLLQFTLAEVLWFYSSVKIT